jgi:hypothetical protein
MVCIYIYKEYINYIYIYIMLFGLRREEVGLLERWRIRTMRYFIMCPIYYTLLGRSNHIRLDGRGL